MRPVIHLTYREALSSVFPAQVAVPMHELHRCGVDVSLVVFAALGEILRRGTGRRLRDMAGYVQDELELDLRILPSPPSRAPGLWRDYRLLSLLLRRESARNAKPPIMHCRNPLATTLALDARPIQKAWPVIYDCRGALVEEYLFYQKNSRDISLYQANNVEPDPELDRLREVELRAARDSDAVLCVSEKMKAYMCDKTGISPSKVTVVPCCVNMKSYDRARHKRETMRRELGLSGKYVITYCGSIKAWQIPEKMAAVFRALKNLVPVSHFLGLTTRPDVLRDVFESKGIIQEDMTLMRVPQGDVPEYLTAGDLGLLVREDNTVNNVASPVKLAEYLAAGMPVAVSRGVGDYTGLVRENGLGFVLTQDASKTPAVPGDEAERFIREYRSKPLMVRERCIAAARNRFSWESTVSKICEVYKKFC